MLISPAILVVIIFLVGPIILQIFLSKREDEWLGLALPIGSILTSIMKVLNTADYTKQSAFEMTIQLIGVFLLWNIPTVILIAIYFACRKKFKKKKEMDKMNIHDLE